MINKNIPYNLIEPEKGKIPFVLSIPHCGMNFPYQLESRYIPGQIEKLDDTDFYLDKLYDFASDLGITVIYAKFSRWVIDLNRDPHSQPLYHDGRIITELCPTKDFFGNPLYRKAEFNPDENEKLKRLENYYFPYHRKIDDILSDLKNEFGQVLFWDAHSIRREVKTIRSEPFPDFILGDNEGKAAGENFSKIVLENMEKSAWQITYNTPFKGGFLTRSKGNPAENIHALQLEMSKDLYMTENETTYDSGKSSKVKEQLIRIFKALIAELER